MLLVLDMYHTWKFLLNIWWPAGWRWKVNKGGWPCYSRRQWLPHSSSQMEHVKKVDPGPGERWVDLYDALRINPTQALQTHNVKVVWKCDSVTSSIFSIGIVWNLNLMLDTIYLFLLTYSWYIFLQIWSSALPLHKVCFCCMCLRHLLRSSELGITTVHRNIFNPRHRKIVQWNCVFDL